MQDSEATYTKSIFVPSEVLDVIKKGIKPGIVYGFKHFTVLGIDNVFFPDLKVVVIDDRFRGTVAKKLKTGEQL